MRLITSLIIVCCVLATSLSSQTRYFLFPSEVMSYSLQFSQTVNVFGIAQYAKNTDPIEVQFLVTDKNGSIRVSYDGIIPDLFEVGSPVIVQGKLDEGIFVATAIFVNFSSNSLPREALNELRSYGVIIKDD